MAGGKWLGTVNPLPRWVGRSGSTESGRRQWLRKDARSRSFFRPKSFSADVGRQVVRETAEKEGGDGRRRLRPRHERSQGKPAYRGGNSAILRQALCAGDRDGKSRIMSTSLTEYDLSVFVNCPFDKAYRPLHDAIVFTVYDCGFIPRSALEAEDQPQRLDRIVEIIGDSRLSIHDLSRAGADRKSGYARFNMPFELGLFLGAMKYGGSRHRSKTFCMLDKERYRYQKFISDLNGYDPHSHSLRVPDAIKCVRNFLRNQTFVDAKMPGGHDYPSALPSFQKAIAQIRRETPSPRTGVDLSRLLFLGSGMALGSRSVTRKPETSSYGEI